MEQFSMKELYDVSLKSTYPMRIGNRDIEIGEKIAVFDKIQLANFNEIKRINSANGGFDNRSHVYWEETKEIQMNFTQGVFSKTQLSLMLNSKMISENGNENPILISKREILESNEKGELELAYKPLNLFIYDAATNEKLSYSMISENIIKIQGLYQNIIADYQYEYKNKVEELVIGSQLTNGYLELEGKTRYKDDVTGHTYTGIIKIPRLKLMSNLSMRLGENASPVVGSFSAIAVPTGERGNKKVMELFFLSDDIDSDM
jgi:hypothetical protein